MRDLEFGELSQVYGAGSTGKGYSPSPPKSRKSKKSKKSRKSRKSRKSFKYC